MSEIEKMYMRCKIKKRQTCRSSDTCYNGSLNKCEGCNSYQYPPFTPEKQLSLIKWFTHKNNRYEFRVLWNIKYYIMLVCETEYGHCEGTGKDKEFSECLAKLTNNIWQDLTSEEQEQIRSILNG